MPTSNVNVGIALGAGGPLGWAYHLGVIEGVREAIGREPANADRIVGTSAGAPIAASVLAGLTTAEILATVTSPPSDQDRAKMKDVRRDALRNPLRTMRPTAPHLIGKIGEVGIATAAIGLLPSGVFPTSPLRRLVAELPEEWSPQLWIPSVRIDDGQLVVFGRDELEVSLPDAIEATSAVPTLFQPKVINGQRYVDGAVASATHADTLLAQEPDVVLISSPMSRPGRGPIRARARRQLNAEAATLRAAGTRTIVLAPNPETLAAAEGFPRNRPDAGIQIVDAARRQTIQAFTEVRRKRSSRAANIADPN